MQKFTPTTEQVRLAEALFAAMAFEQTIQPIVEDYENAILRKHQFHIDPAWIEKGHMEDQLILDRRKSFLLSKNDADLFNKECFDARDKAGLKVSHPDNCPLLEAVHLRMDCENQLLRAMSTIPGLENFGEAHFTLATREKAINLTLKLLAPFCADSSQIIKRLTAAA